MPHPGAGTVHLPVIVMGKRKSRSKSRSVRANGRDTRGLRCGYLEQPGQEGLDQSTMLVLALYLILDYLPCERASTRKNDDSSTGIVIVASGSLALANHTLRLPKAVQPRLFLVRPPTSQCFSPTPCAVLASQPSSPELFPPFFLRSAPPYSSIHPFSPTTHSHTNQRRPAAILEFVPLRRHARAPLLPFSSQQTTSPCSRPLALPTIKQAGPAHVSSRLSVRPILVSPSTVQETVPKKPTGRKRRTTPGFPCYGPDPLGFCHFCMMPLTTALF